VQISLRKIGAIGYLKAMTAHDTIFVMPKYIALLRAVNVGGTGKLSMADLKQMCCDAGFENVQTYIASGNVVFDSKDSRAKVKSTLEKRLHEYAGKPVGVVLRTGAEMKAVLEANPFPKAAPNYNSVFFLDEKPSKDALEKASGVANEEMRLGRKEIYVHYPMGMGRSKLRIPVAKAATARNMNTVAKLAEMASKK
jgi:uncharacterized protein (DUF1697 family)